MQKDKNGKFIVPMDYSIDYNKNKNYNELDNSYLPPYRSKYSSIYEGIQLEMHIVDHCNLNCNCCNHFAPLAQPNYITIENFKEQLINIKNNIPTVKELLLLGGEPLLHPEFIQLCKIAREIMGYEIFISVLSNGTIVDVLKNNLLTLEKLNIHFHFTVYKDTTKINELESLGFKDNIYNTRIISKQTLVNLPGSLNKHFNFFNCTNHKLPCLTAKDNKLYICPFCAHVEHFCKSAKILIPEEENIDYLDITKIQGNLDLIQKFIFTPKNYCKYCAQHTDAVPYQESSKNITEFTTRIKQLYFKDYNQYEQIINAGKEHIKWCFDKNKNPGHNDIIFQEHDVKNEYIRYLGKIDIIIPYYNETIEQFIRLENNLLMQDIIDDCAIYLISDNSDMDLGVMNIFNYSPLHCVFLKNLENLGPGVTRNKGIINSHNEIILFLDVDDLFIDKHSLNKLYNEINNPNIDLIEFTSYSKDNVQKSSFMVKRKVLEQNNLLYKPFYFGEDREFYFNLIAHIHPSRIKHLNNISNDYIGYNVTTNNTNLTSTFIFYDDLHFSLLSSNIIGLKEMSLSKNLNEEELQFSIPNFLRGLLQTLQDNPQLQTNEFIKSFIYYILYELKPLTTPGYHQNLYNSIETFLQINLEDNQIDLIKKFLYNYIKENYLNHKKLKNNAIYMLQLLSEDNKCQN